jgi:uncharacterized protein YecE (DUF72 family)
MLAYYAARFAAVEVNYTHYRLPSAQVFDNWRQAVPAGFVFAVKASRSITHFRRLKPPFERYARFFDSIARLGAALGPVLFQLPPQFRRDDDRLEAFLAALPAGLRPVMEFRHPSWETAAVRALLAAHGAALCVTDLAGRLSLVAATAPLAYVRLHGPEEAYRGSYDDQALERWCAQARLWQGEGREVFIFFDNDAKAMAIADALRLTARLAALRP